MHPLAIIPVYNEADILPAVLQHLEQQGCDVYVLDNWSTDLTPELLSVLGDRIERWPAERPTMYAWTEILTRIEEIALERGKGRWVILHDADEIRRVPADWSTLTLAQALEIVTITGYNAIHFEVRTFVPVDNSWTAGADPERHFRHYRNEHVDHGLPHVKAWFQGDERVDLHTHGGHQVVFSNRYLCPHPFLLKHYPIRSQQHGERKVLKERFPRYPPNERSKRWHVQYDEYVQKPAPNFIGNAAELRKDKNNTAILTITNCPATFHAFADAVEKHEPSYRKIVVSVGDVTIDRPGWEQIRGTSTFSRNLSLGIAAAGCDDVLYVSDDIEFVGPIVEELSDVAYLTSAAIVSAQVISGDAPAHPVYWMDSRWKQTRQYIPFACVLLRRSVLDTLGNFDASDSAFAPADMEFTGRAVAQGFPLIVCRCRVRHQPRETEPSIFLPALAGVAH